MSLSNNKKRFATSAVFSSILFMSGVFAAPPAYTNDDFEEADEEDDTLNEGERDVVDELADEWTGDDNNQDDNDDEQQQLGQLPLEEQDSNSNRIHVNIDDNETKQSILDTPEIDDPVSDIKDPSLINDKEPAAVNDEEDTGFDDAGTLDLAEQEDTDDAEDDTAANLEDDGTKAAENETPEDSELTVEKPWDDSTSEEEESHDTADDNTSTESALDDNEQADDIEQELTPDTMDVDDSTETEFDQQLPQDVKTQEINDMDSSTAQPIVDQQQDDSMIKLDDYQVDNTVEEINQSLEKALDNLQQPGSIADQNERLEFANTNNFFPDENPQRYPSTIPPPIPSTTPEQEGFSVSMLFFIALSLFLLIKAPKIKRYLTPRSGDYKSTLPYHHAHGKTRD